MGLEKEFFDLKALMTMGGATASTFIVSNAIQAAFNYNPKWLALVIAEAICLGGTFFAAGRGSDYFVAILNGCLVYLTAVGTNQLTSPKDEARARSARAATDPQRPTDRRRFLSSWF